MKANSILARMAPAVVGGLFFLSTATPSLAQTTSAGDVFAMRGIDREAGCLIVVRPDQYVAHVLPLEARAELAAFFDGFMTPAA